MIIDVLGYIGAVAFSICGIPQVVRCFKLKSASDLSWSFLVLWSVGEVTMLIHVCYAAPSIPLIINYIFCGVICTLLLVAKTKWG